MKITYIGHSCVLLEGKDGTILIDPYFTGNTEMTYKDVKPDYILLTHGHRDHTEHVKEIAQNSEATIISVYELASFYSAQGLFSIGANIGGSIDLGFAKVSLVAAIHSSSMYIEETKEHKYAGLACGYVVEMDNRSAYHAGDTALFGDMEQIGSTWNLDVALLPIGGLFTMGPHDAKIAADLLNAKLIIPIHYNTFEAINQDPNAFVSELVNDNNGGKVLLPNTSFTV